MRGGVVFEQLPAGVWPVRDYPSLGLTLVECEHDPQHQRPTKGWVAVAADGRERPLPGFPDSREARQGLREGETLDYLGVLLCRVCRADEIGTLAFSRRVKLLAAVPDTAAGQPALF